MKEWAADVAGRGAIEADVAADRAADAVEEDDRGLILDDEMKQSGITRLFILVCIAVLFASYGVGLGVRKIRGVDAQAPAVAAAETEKPTDKPESDADEVVADTEAGSEPSEEWAEEPYEEAAEEVTARPKRSGGGNAQMVVVGSEGPKEMREQLRKMAAEERARTAAEERARMAAEERARKELQAARAKTDEENLRRVQEAWPNLDEETRGKISGIMERWPTMSEEERDYHRAGNID